MTYTRKIESPTTTRDGWTNHVQMVINLIEAGETVEAVLIAVDLQDRMSGCQGAALDDLQAGEAKVSLKERDDAVAAAKAEAYRAGFEAGRRKANSDLKALLDA